jgi:hypothetical protein
MKKILKEISLYSLPFLGLIIVLFFINILKKDFTFGHFLHSTYKSPYNWLHELTVLPINKFFIKLKNDNKEYLSQVRLYASQTKLNSLIENLPNSTKSWKTGKIIHDSDKRNLKDVKFRLRGDNPENWLLEKKSFRIKFKKSEMNGRYRYYNYLPFDPRTLISNRLARKSNLLAPNVRPVELILNEEKKGLYLELETFNENFLRRNRVMPVNFYKGENYNQEIKIGLGNNLYSNIGLWTKESYFNFYNKEFNSDLKLFLKTLKQSKNSPKKFKTLRTFLDEEYIGRYLAYIIASQNYHVSKYHNNRIIVDTWKGQIFPVITDPDNFPITDLNFDTSTNDLTSILNQSSIFLNLKYKYLHKFIVEDKILINEINYLNNIKENVVNVLKNDPTKINILLDLFSNNENYNILEKNIQNLKERQKTLISELKKEPNVSWTKNINSFSLILDSQLPVNKVELFFKKKIPDWVFIDENYNNTYDLNEVKFFKKDNKIALDVSLYSNRINVSNHYNLFYDNITTSPTKFNLISSNGTFPSDVKIGNFFLKDLVLIKYASKLFGSQSNQLNKVLFEKNIKDKIDHKILSGKIIVKDQLIFENPVIIKPGTIFLLNKNANVIFKNKVEAKGDKDNKIIFRANSKEPWGTVALLGKNTSRSEFNHVEFYDGSGSFTDQFTFSSMFSIHNTSNINLKNISLKNNHSFDDMMHIIYSSNITMDNISFFNAFGDAIDIDICENIKISNSNFYNSKNDGIDLMESNVDISNVNIFNSLDKAISIGESSSAKLINSVLENNEIAIAVKDNSKVFIKDVNFLNNKNQVFAYKKNLQYGNGGNAEVFNSVFNSKTNNFLSENSNISIKDSRIIGSLNKEGKQIFINERK